MYDYNTKDQSMRMTPEGGIRNANVPECYNHIKGWMLQSFLSMILSIEHENNTALSLIVYKTELTQ